MRHTAFIPKDLTEEIKLFTFGRDSFYLKDLATLGVILGFFLVCSTFVNGWFLVPYFIIAAIVSIYLILPAKKTNPGKRNWEAILLLIVNSRSTVFMLNPVRDKGVDILWALPEKKEETENEHAEHEF